MKNKFFLLAVPIIILCACAKNENIPAKEQTPVLTPPLDAAARQIDSSKAFLTEGCVVLRKGNDAISKLFTMFNQTDKSFSHCGIAFKDNNAWYVFHAIGGEDNPDSKLRKDKFEKFVVPADNFGFGICNFSLNKQQITKLRAILDSLYLNQVPFDMQFDLQSNDRLYCAELVYKSIQQATDNDSLFSVNNHNGYKFVSTDNIFVNKQAQMLCRVKY